MDLYVCDFEICDTCIGMKTVINFEQDIKIKEMVASVFFLFGLSI